MRKASLRHAVRTPTHMGNASLLFTGAFSVRLDDVCIVSSRLSRDISWTGRGTEDHALQRCPVGKFEDRALILALAAAAPATTSSVQLASSTALSFHTREAPPSHVCRRTALPAAAEPPSTPAHSPLRADSTVNPSPETASCQVSPAARSQRPRPSPAPPQVS